jgi:hypothetical protein
MNPTLITIGTWMLYVACVPANLAPLAYTRVPWRRTAIGKHLMMYMISIALVLDLSTLSHFVNPRSVTFQWLRLLAFGFVVICLWWRLWLFAAAVFRRRGTVSHQYVGDEIARR